MKIINPPDKVIMQLTGSKVYDSKIKYRLLKWVGVIQVDEENESHLKIFGKPERGTILHNYITGETLFFEPEEDDVFDEGTDAVPSENSQGRDTGDAGQSSANAANSQSENNPDREAGSESKTKADNKGNHTDSVSNKGSNDSSTTTSTKSAGKPATNVSGKSQDAQSKVAGQGTKSLTGMSIGAIALGIIVVLVVIFAIVRKRCSKHSDK